MRVFQNRDEYFLLFKRMPNWARRTKGWCKPMATAALSNPEEEIVPPVKNLCERLGPQRGPQLHSRSQEQILHLILAKRPRRYAEHLKLLLLVLANFNFPLGVTLYFSLLQLIQKRKAESEKQVLSFKRCLPAPSDKSFLFGSIFTLSLLSRILPMISNNHRWHLKVEIEMTEKHSLKQQLSPKVRCLLQMFFVQWREDKGSQETGILQEKLSKEPRQSMYLDDKAVHMIFDLK